MSVFVYKDGDCELIDPMSLDAALKSGWSVDENAKEVPDEGKADEGKESTSKSKKAKKG